MVKFATSIAAVTILAGTALAQSSEEQFERSVSDYDYLDARSQDAMVYGRGYEEFDLEVREPVNWGAAVKGAAKYVGKKNKKHHHVNVNVGGGGQQQDQQEPGRREFNDVFETRNDRRRSRNRSHRGPAVSKTPVPSTPSTPITPSGSDATETQDAREFAETYDLDAREFDEFDVREPFMGSGWVKSKLRKFRGKPSHHEGGHGGYGHHAGHAGSPHEHSHSGGGYPHHEHPHHEAAAGPSEAAPQQPMEGREYADVLEVREPWVREKLRQLRASRHNGQRYGGQHPHPHHHEGSQPPATPAAEPEQQQQVAGREFYDVEDLLEREFEDFDDLD